MKTALVSLVRQAPATRTAGLTLAAAVAALGAISVANAAGVGKDGGVRSDASALVKKCASQDYSSGCIAGINSSVGNGVFGRNTAGGIGVEGQSDGRSAAVMGYNDGKAGGYGVSARSLYGDALYSYSDTGASVFAESGLGGGTASVPLWLESHGSTGAPLILGEWGSNVVLEADIAGNLYLSGLLYSSGNCRNGCSRTRHLTSFGARTSEPTLDDDGEGTLHGGSAHVALDPAFENAIDTAKPYVVMLTPEGDAGLYVTNRAAGGFDVRQLGGGHSSISFAYRIVAKPYGVRDERLPFHSDPAASQVAHLHPAP
jgi:hypothetical protein